MVSAAAVLRVVALVAVVAVVTVHAGAVSIDSTTTLTAGVLLKLREGLRSFVLRHC
jgi:hypothetical protein